MEVDLSKAKKFYAVANRGALMVFGKTTPTLFRTEAQAKEWCFGTEEVKVVYLVVEDD
jgi:hypothetical protein